MTWTGGTDVYAQRINGSGVVQWTANGVPVCTAAGNQSPSGIVPDGAGGYIITWGDARGANVDVYAQRIDASGAAQWTADGVPICTAASNQDTPRIAPDGSGGAIVAWRDLRSTVPSSYDVYAQRIDASGAVQWTANGVAISTRVGSDQWHIEIVSDGAGGAIVVWEDKISLNQDIYAQRINAAGTVQWTVNGVALCQAANNQNWQGFLGSTFGSTIVSDGGGGAIVTWSDRRTGAITFDDIYAQRIDASGAVQWTADGVAVCTAVEDQAYPAIAPDGNGGAIMAWQDKRGGNSYIYAQKLDATGAVQWAANGVQPSPVTGTSAYPSVVSDGAGGAIVIWQHSTWGIIAQRLGPTGLVPTGIGDTPPGSAVALGGNYPNPFSAGTMMDIDLAADSEVSVDVFDVAGRRVRELRLGHVSAGPRTVQFDGRDATGRALPSGVYFYRVTATGATITKKMVIAR